MGPSDGEKEEKAYTCTGKYRKIRVDDTYEGECMTWPRVMWGPAIEPWTDVAHHSLLGQLAPEFFFFFFFFILLKKREKVSFSFLRDWLLLLKYY